MELFIIFVLLVVIGIMYNNKKEADDRERERIEPGFLERRNLKNRIISRLVHILNEQNNRIENARKKGEKIRFWTHVLPKNPGHYQVQYQDKNQLSYSPDYDILFYRGVLECDEWGHYDYDDTYVFPKLLTTTAYFDGIRYDVENVRYHLFEMK